MHLLTFLFSSLYSSINISFATSVLAVNTSYLVASFLQTFIISVFATFIFSLHLWTHDSSLPAPTRGLAYCHSPLKCGLHRLLSFSLITSFVYIIKCKGYLMMPCLIPDFTLTISYFYNLSLNFKHKILIRSFFVLPSIPYFFPNFCIIFLLLSSRILSADW